MKRIKINCSCIKKAICQIPLVDKCLVLFMIVLLGQLAFSLFYQNAHAQEVNTIDVVIRTSTASIFGYFLSANFIRKKTSSDTKQSGGGKNKEMAQHLTGQGVRDYMGVSASENEKEHERDGISFTDEKEDSEANIENRLQIIIATAIGIFCLVTLLLLRNVGDWNRGWISLSSTNATISQFRDFVSGCVGFLIGCPSNHSNSK